MCKPSTLCRWCERHALLHLPLSAGGFFATSSDLYSAWHPRHLCHPPPTSLPCFKCLAADTLLQLRESGTPLEQIQLGRAEDDDETFLDVLDAEQDEWMRR